MLAHMAPKTKTKVVQPVVQRRALALSGGLAGRKFFVPETCDFDISCSGDILRVGERDATVEKPQEFVLITTREAWLCEMATGLPVYQRPLKRVSILKQLRAWVVAAGSATDDKMAALAFDDSDSDVMETPKKKKPGRREQRCAAPAVAVPSTCQLVQAPLSPTEPDKKISVHAAVDRRGRLWLSAEALPWFLDYVRAEKNSGGVAPIEEETSAVAEGSRITWNFRNDSWQAQAQGPDGKWLKTSKGLKGIRKQEGLDDQAAKQRVYEAMQAWVADVEAGLLTQEDEA